MDEALRGGEKDDAQSDNEASSTDGTPDEADDADDADDNNNNNDTAFDYLGYAQERALFFWGDILQLGLVQREELPAEVLRKVKIVPY